MTLVDDPRQPRKQQHRTWSQRITLLGVCLCAIACFVAAGALAAGQWVLSQRNFATLGEPVSSALGAGDPTVVVPSAVSGTTVPGSIPSGVPSTTAPPIVLAEPDAANFLVVGADNNDCGDDPITDERTELGERSDTIMVWRANPATNQLAVLSFPRDLYVKYPNGNKNRINAAFERDDPRLLQEVLWLNFGIPVNHYIQIDFCAFRRLVSAVGGVEVPFQFPARDKPQNGNGPAFLVEDTGCVNLDGDAALQYVRSRHYQYEDPPGSGNWVDDPTSDFGRISRQQDFLRRVLAKVVDQGLYDPDVAGALITTNRDYLVTDPDLTVRRMLEFANALKNFDPDAVTTYRIDSSNQTINGDSVEIPRIKNDNMQAILAIFRGQATLAGAPEQELESTTTIAVLATEADDDSSTESSTQSTGDSSADDSSAGPPATTLPAVTAEENVVGIAPDRAVNCG